MKDVEKFNENLDDHRFVVIPISSQVGYVVPDDSGSGWGTWHLDVSDAVFCDKVSVELGGK